MPTAPFARVGTSSEKPRRWIVFVAVSGLCFVFRGSHCRFQVRHGFTEPCRPSASRLNSTSRSLCPPTSMSHAQRLAAGSAPAAAAVHPQVGLGERAQHGSSRWTSCDMLRCAGGKKAPMSGADGTAALRASGVRRRSHHRGFPLRRQAQHTGGCGRQCSSSGQRTCDPVENLQAEGNPNLCVRLASS